MASAIKTQKPPTKSMPVPQGKQQATGGKSPVKSGKSMPKGCC
ncbi:MAG: hypothetical protein RLZZ524_1426 [Pseudomonadota bacterium]|jgi:hypothetical protein